MFTGIIEEIGTVKRVMRKNRGIILTVEGDKVIQGIKTGESIGINGVCLTILKKERNNFYVEVSPATLRNTTFSSIRIGKKVNLERPITLATRLGGHMVTGHVDGKGKIVEKKGEKEFLLKISYPDSFSSYLIPKGSIAIDGVSLTIQSLDKDTFQTFIISHTASNTTLKEKKVGEEVNIEFDFLIKIFYKWLNEKKPLHSKLEKAGFY